MLRGGIVALLLVLASVPPPAAAQGCPGDCSGDGEVAVNELITCVAIALAGAAPSACGACDADANDEVGITDLVAGVNAALSGCPAGELPDLVPVAVRLVSDTPPCILDTSEIRLSLEVCVSNSGAAASGAFTTELLGEEVARTSGLAVGGEACVTVPYVPFDVDVLVDSREEVAESDESDNFESFVIPQPTPPPFCTASPTVTGTPGATDTPSATATATASETATASGTPTGTATPTETAVPTDTAAPTETPTDTAVPTDTPTPTETAAPTDTATPGETAVPTDTPVATATDTPTETPPPTATGLPTGTATATQAPALG